MYIAPLPVWCVAAVALLGLAVGRYLLAYLKRAHPMVWVELGSPSLLLNNSIRNNWLSIKFLWSARHRELHDEKLSRLVWAMRVLSVLLTVLCLFVTLLGYGRHPR
jgi:hypothetical protein